MNTVSLWYRGLGRSTRIGIAVAFAVLVLALAGVIAYLVLVPQKVEVKFGTIVRDPVDGRVWSDDTKTAMVDPDQASKYRIEYIDKLSPEHEQELAEKRALEEAEKAMLEQSQGFQSLSVPVTSQQAGDMQSLQQSIQSLGSGVVSGMEMAGQIGDTKSQIVSYRNQIAAIPVPPQFEATKQQVLQVFDMYIQACDLYLQGIATADMSYIDQANSIASEATAKLQGLVPPSLP